MDFPGQPQYLPTHLTIAHMLGFNPMMVWTPSFTSSVTWPTANLAAFYPIVIPYRYSAQRFFSTTGSGAASSNTFDIGLYTYGGTRIWSAGSTNQGTSSALGLWYTAISGGLMLDPGRYYLAHSFSNAASNTLFGSSSGTDKNARMLGIQQVASSHPLPSSVTFAAVTTTLFPIPYFGFTRTASGY